MITTVNSDPPDAAISAMWKSLRKKNPHDSSIAQGKGVASSTPNAKANKPKETIFAGNHLMSKALVSIDLVKEMMEQNIVECPYDYVPGKEFLPDFALDAMIDCHT